MSTPERAGWYDDPEDESQLRYFDGVVWSQHRVPRRAPAPEPVPQTQHSAGPQRDVFGRPTQPTQPPQAAPDGWPQTQEGAPTTDEGEPLAGIGARFGAYLIDATVLGFLIAVVSGWAWYRWIADYWSYVYDAAMAGDTAAVEGLSPEQIMSMLDMRYMVIATGLSLLVLAVYHVGFLATLRATPGKLVLGLSVRRADRPGRLGVGTAFMRVLLPLALGVMSALPLISLFATLIWVVDKLWPLRDPRRQALHDKVAGTLVVVSRRGDRAPGAR